MNPQNREEFDRLLNKYKIYINTNNIEDDYIFNFKLISIYIEDYNKFINNTAWISFNGVYLYLKAIYYYIVKKFGIMLNILHNINNEIKGYSYTLIGYYYETIKHNKNLTLENYKKGLEKNCVFAAYRLGRFYQDYYDKNTIAISNMINYYSIAIKNKHSFAMLLLGFYYITNSQKNKAKKYYHMALTNSTYYENETAIKIALYHLGFYYNSVGNDELAKKYHLLAIEKQNTNAMCDLAIYYENIEKNDTLTVKYNMMAIELQNPKGMFNLAYYYSSKKNNYNEMKKYYNMVIELKNENYLECLEGLEYLEHSLCSTKSKAMLNLALYYFHIENNDDLGLKYILMAIQLNNPYAMLGIGNYYKKKRDYKEMKKYYQMAIKYKNTSAMVAFGNYYRQISDYDNMKIYYNMAMELGDNKAFFEMATFYYSNKYFSINGIEEKKKIEKYYKICIKNNDSNAMNNLASYYLDNNIHDNLTVKYYLMAINLGNVIAMNNLGRYYGMKGNYTMMKEYYIMALNNRNDYSAYRLADHYHYIEINYDLALKYYLMGVNKGNFHCRMGLMEFCKIIEGNENNYYKYIYYPKILMLIIINKRCKLFLPLELWKTIIWEEYIFNHYTNKT